MGTIRLLKCPLTMSHHGSISTRVLAKQAPTEREESSILVSVQQSLMFIEHNGDEAKSPRGFDEFSLWLDRPSCTNVMEDEAIERRDPLFYTDLRERATANRMS